MGAPDPKRNHDRKNSTAHRPAFTFASTAGLSRNGLAGVWNTVQTQAQTYAARLLQTRRAKRLLFCAIFIVLCLSKLVRPRLTSLRTNNILHFIDPLIGTSHGGHVFPGANIPYGMAKAGADCANENAGGYSTDQPCEIIGFSHTHDSGTGGATSFGNFGIFPQPGCLNDTLDNCFKTRRSFELMNSTVATPGYFAIAMQNGVHAQMTTTAHAALYEFQFNRSSDFDLSPVVSVNMRDLFGSLRGGNVTVSPETGRMVGWGQYQPSFGPAVWRFALGAHDEHYTLYFCADFKGASVRRTGSWAGDKVEADVNSADYGTHHARDWGAYVQFDASTGASSSLLARVGVSFISHEQACRNGEEIKDWNFGRVFRESEQAWKSKFANIAIDSPGVSHDIQTMFWSGIYRSFISPQDYTGENPLWNSTEPYYDSFYCIWDSFRSTDPFLNIIDPVARTDMLRALLDIYKHEGKLPDCRMSLCKGDTQGGSNADVVVTDAYVKNLRAGVDWNLAYEAVVSDAEVEPADWSLEGRGDLEAWKNIGYVPVDPKAYTSTEKHGEGLDSRSVSRSLEYAYNDFTIATLAKSLGHMDDYSKYINRSRNWEKLWNPDTTSRVKGEDSGFKGFMQPRLANGTFKYEDPNLCNPLVGMERACYFFQGGYSTYEGGSWLYSFYVPHDMAALIEKMGGKETFVRRLSYFHETGLVDIGDELAFLTPFLYHYAGRPALSSKVAAELIVRNFSATVGGIPGNDDSGAMGSFIAFIMMGFFPNAGQDVYFLTAPWFAETRLRHPQTGRTASIRVVNFDHRLDAPATRFIQSVKLNGKDYKRNWITHDFFSIGGKLEIVLADHESSWGTDADALPPSWSTSEHS